MGNVIDLGSSKVSFKLGDLEFDLDKITRKSYQSYVEKQNAINELEDENEKAVKVLDLTEELIVSQGFDRKNLGILPMAAYEVIINNLVKKN